MKKNDLSTKFSNLNMNPVVMSLTFGFSILDLSDNCFYSVSLTLRFPLEDLFGSRFVEEEGGIISLIYFELHDKIFS